MNESIQSREFGYHKGKTLQALRYHFISRKEIRIMMIAVNLFAVASAVLFFLFRISPLAFLISASLWFLMMIVCWFLLPARIFKGSDMFRVRFHAEIDEQGLALHAESGSSRWEWKKFSQYLESPHFFHLYFSGRSFFLIPKEAFVGEELDKARKLLRKHISR